MVAVEGITVRCDRTVRWSMTPWPIMNTMVPGAVIVLPPYPV